MLFNNKVEEPHTYVYIDLSRESIFARRSINTAFSDQSVKSRSTRELKKKRKKKRKTGHCARRATIRENYNKIRNVL